MCYRCTTIGAYVEPVDTPCALNILSPNSLICLYDLHNPSITILDFYKIFNIFGKDLPFIPHQIDINEIAPVAVKTHIQDASIWQQGLGGWDILSLSGIPPVNVRL